LTKDTIPAVCITESLEFFDEDARKEGEIISRTLRLSGRKAHYSYVRTRDEFEAFVKEFGSSNYRYLHISCHGDVGEFHLTTEMISTEEFANILAPHVRGRRIFLSTCLAGDSKFARLLLPDSGCLSILAPASTIDFADAAIFWTAFYHLRFKANPDAMKRDEVIDTATRCAKLVGQQFRFFYVRDGKMHRRLLGA
jgi:hypothetical protein